MGFYGGGGSYERGTPVISAAPRQTHSGALRTGALVQGCLADEKTYSPRTLQQAYAQVPAVLLGGGRFLMSEVPLYGVC